MFLAGRQTRVNGPRRGAHLEQVLRRLSKIVDNRNIQQPAGTLGPCSGHTLCQRRHQQPIQGSLGVGGKSTKSGCAVTLGQEGGAGRPRHRQGSAHLDPCRLGICLFSKLLHGAGQQLERVNVRLRTLKVCGMSARSKIDGHAAASLAASGLPAARSFSAPPASTPQMPRQDRGAHTGPACTTATKKCMGKKNKGF